MVPSSYLEFMITAAGAAGAMIGLLFVAISLRSDLVFGERAAQRVKTLAASSFTGLANAFSLALLAVVPKTNIGVGMIILAALCLYTTLKLHARSSGDTQYRVLFLASLNYSAQLAGGVTLLIRPHAEWIVTGLCYVIFASFIIALTRAWQLIQSDSTPSASS